MPGHKDIVIDTRELAETMDDVNGGMKQTTAAVSKTNTSVKSMAAAVCAAETAAAVSVSKNVTKGFRGLIAVQMAQRKIECHAAVQAKALQLSSFNDMLLHLGKQLQGDYERITKRYSKIMQQLGDALKSRIYNLDAPAARVADQGYRELINRTLTNATSSVLIDQDIQPLSSMIAAARCKDDCIKSMEQLKTLVIGMRKLRDDLEKSVRDVAIDNSCRRCLPVIIMERDDLNVADFHQTDIRVGDSEEQRRIEKSVRSECERQSGNFNWREGGNSSTAIIEKILGMVGSKDLPDRQRDIIKELVKRCRWQELEAVK